MRKAITLIVILIASISSHSSPLVTNSEFISVSVFNKIDDGWYEATVNYSNYKTGTNATYTLNVKVEYGVVAKIDFGNGGSVHSGYNNEGYIYTGGYLSFEKNYNGDIVAATTTVTVSDENGMRYFKIRIQ